MVDHPFTLILRDLGERLRTCLTRSGEDDEVAKSLKQVFNEPARFVAGVNDPSHHREKRRTVRRRESVHSVVQQGGVGESQERNRPLVGDAIRPGPGDELIEHRQGVTDRAAARAHHKGIHTRIDGHALLTRQLRKVIAQHGGRH